MHSMESIECIFAVSFHGYCPVFISFLCVRLSSCQYTSKYEVTFRSHFTPNMYKQFMFTISLTETMSVHPSVCPLSTLLIILILQLLLKKLICKVYTFHAILSFPLRNFIVVVVATVVVVVVIVVVVIVILGDVFVVHHIVLAVVPTGKALITFDWFNILEEKQDLKDLEMRRIYTEDFVR